MDERFKNQAKTFAVEEQTKNCTTIVMSTLVLLCQSRYVSCALSLGGSKFASQRSSVVRFIDLHFRDVVFGIFLSVFRIRMTCY